MHRHAAGVLIDAGAAVVHHDGVGAEFLAASDFGLGWVIFDAKEFLNADLMLASLIVIGGIGFAFERLVFGSIEKATVQRWGMVRMAKG